MENEKKLPLWAIISVIVLFVALTAVVVMLVLGGSDKADKADKADKETTAAVASENADEPTDSAEEPATEPKEPGVEGYGTNSTVALYNYSVTEAAPNDVNMSQVIAINADGEACLTNGQMQIYYWIEFYNFMNSYGDYVSMMGLDASQPLYSQTSLQEGTTWEQYFLEAAAKNYSDNYALAQAAYANGYTISEEDEQNIADIADPNGSFAAEAKEYGYESSEAYLQANFGKGVGVADYQNYLRTYYAASDYYLSQKEAMTAAATEEEVVAHYDENAEAFAEQGLAKVNNIAVRHILIKVEGEQDENGEYSAEAWAEAEKKANELYEQWKKNPTEENFATMATEHSTDAGSQESGGLYDEVHPGQMVTEFNDWCFDASRVTGDHAIVKTPYGYHIMYFVKQTETRQWYDEALKDMVNVQLNEMLDECVEKYPLLFDYYKVRLYDMVTTSIATETEE